MSKLKSALEYMLSSHCWLPLTDEGQERKWHSNTQLVSTSCPLISQKNPVVPIHPSTRLWFIMFHGQKSNIFWYHSDLSYPSISLHMGKSPLPFMAWRRRWSSLVQGSWWKYSPWHPWASALGTNQLPGVWLQCHHWDLDSAPERQMWHLTLDWDLRFSELHYWQSLPGTWLKLTNYRAVSWLTQSDKATKRFWCQRLSWLLKEKDWQHSQPFAITKVGVQHTAHEAQWGCQEHPIWHSQGIQESLYTV